MTDGGPSPLVREGDTVIFDINGERKALITVDGKSELKLGKVFCSAAPLIGCPYGSMFALSADGKSLERTEYVPSADWELPTPDVAPDFNTRTNADLVDANGNQQLSTADIEAMKAAGHSGADIVAALTANSSTFATKTEFSQEKYKKKKARKYIQVGTVRRPTAAAVCEAYFTNNPAKTAYLRVDSLALLLSMANVGAHARVLVVEACGGLVTAAVAERLGGYGAVCSAWPACAKKPSLELWRHFNFTTAQRGGIRFAPLQALLAERQQQQGQGQQGQEQQEQEQLPAAASEAGQQQQQDQPAVAAEQAAEPMQVQEAAEPAAAPEQQQQQQQQQGAPPAAAAAAAAAQEPAEAAALQQPPFNSCILASNGLSPLALVRHVLPLLAPSASFAVYCPWQHPLAEAMDALRGQGQVANLALHESWFREMQVLPLRTHPLMNMNHGGGFILSGTVLAPRQ